MFTKIPIDFPEKIALVHEWFSSRAKGGAEQVVESIDQYLLEKGTRADIYSLIDSQSDASFNWLSNRTINTSFIQNIPFGIKHVQQFLPLLPFAIEQLNLDDFPLVISSNHLVAKGVLTSPDQLHVSYIHTPVRYAWDQMNIYLKHSLLSKFGAESIIRYQLYKLRQWDQLSAQRVDLLIANSSFTARRIEKYWGRTSTILHPPVNINRFRFNQNREDFYLCLSRLVPNKRVDLVVNAFNELQLPLLVVGDGPEKNHLRKIAGPSVKLLGRVSSKEVEKLMESCRAFVYAGVEDFGIAPVEAMASGAPVIAYARGGLLDSVRCLSSKLSSPTGILFPKQSVRSMVDAVCTFENSRLWRKFSSEEIRLWAENFSEVSFKSNFDLILQKAWRDHSKSLQCSSSLMLENTLKVPEDI